MINQDVSHMYPRPRPTCRFVISLLSIVAFLFSAPSAQAQLTVGEFADIVLMTDSYVGSYNNGCAALNLNFMGTTPYVVGMELYLSIDSIVGAGSLELWQYPDYQQDPIYPGDVIPIQTGYGGTALYLYFSAQDTVYYSIHAIGIPLVAGQTYGCSLNYYPILVSDACYEEVRNYFPSGEDCMVGAGQYVVTNDSCSAATTLNPGLNWVYTIGATGESGPVLPCWNGGGEMTEQAGVWYQFTTSTVPTKVELSIHPSYVGQWGMASPQIALFTECGSTAVACSSPGPGSSASLLMDCGDLLPNSPYFVLVEGWNGEEGLAALVYYPFEGCNDLGCMDPVACNYDPSADIDDGSCLYGVDCLPELDIEAVHCNSFTVNYPFADDDPGGMWTLNGEMIFSPTHFSDMFADMPPGDYLLCYSFIYPSLGDTIQHVCSPFNVDASCTCGFELDAVADTAAQHMLDLTLSFDPTTAVELLWDFGDGTTSTEPFPSHEYPDNGPYNLCLTAVFQITDTTTCESASCILLNGTMTGEEGPFGFSWANPTGLHDKEEPEMSWHIWPNPANEALNWGFSRKTSGGPPVRRFKIYSITGRLISEIAVDAGHGEGRINIGSLAPGMYILSIESDQVVLASRYFVKVPGK